MSGLLERQQRQVNNLLETLYIEIQSQIIPNITIDNLDRLCFPSKTNRLVVGTEFTFTFPQISSRLLLVSIVHLLRFPLFRQVWINIFVLDLAQFVSDNLRLLHTWQEVFTDSLAKAGEKKTKVRD